MVNSPKARFCKQCGRSLASAAFRSTPPLSQNLAVGTGMLASNHRLQNGRYRIIRRIGKGGMGAVYLAEDMRLGQSHWAIKEMSDAHLDPSARLRAVAAFEQEANLMATMLNHPNIPRVIDYFSENGKKYLVMAYVDGETLEERLNRNQGRPLPEREVMSWAIQLCQVLTYLHTLPQPIIFRDIKPANIMVDGKGQIKLIDFGIARLFKPGQTKDTIRIGSPGYAPPEQYGKGQTDGRSDIYALGATLHQLLTGQDPAVNPFKFRPPHLLNPQVSQPISQAIMTTLELKPEHRFPDMVALQNALAIGAETAGYTIPLPASSTPQSLPATPKVATPASLGPAATPQGKSGSANPGWSPILPDPHILGRRLVAYLIDGILLTAVFAAYFFLTPIIHEILLFFLWDDDLTQWATVMGLGLLATITYLLYFTFFHARSGQTIGKMLVNIEVRQTDTTFLSWQRSLWRAFVLFVSQFTGLILLSYLLPLVTEKRQTIHDLLAKTFVIHEMKQ